MSSAVWERTESYLVDRLRVGDADLEHARRVSADAGLPDIAVSTLQGQQLHLLASIAGARRILEVGCLGGYSTLWLAKALPAGGRMLTIDNNPLHTDVARTSVAAAGLDDRVEIRLGNAADELARLAEEEPAPFDFFFVDADQHNNVAYLEGCLRLARSGSVFVLDNVVRRGEVSDDATTNPAVAATREVLEMVGRSRAVDGVVFQTVGARGHDGMLVVRVR